MVNNLHAIIFISLSPCYRFVSTVVFDFGVIGLKPLSPGLLKRQAALHCQRCGVQSFWRLQAWHGENIERAASRIHRNLRLQI
jgi:hypothetical protein